LPAKLANLSVGLFLNPSDVILKMPFDLSLAHTFPATEGDNVGGGLKVLLDQDHCFDEILAAGHRCLLLDFDHLILVWRQAVRAPPGHSRGPLPHYYAKGYETSKSATYKF
jgi:hypothetical protein